MIGKKVKINNIGCSRDGLEGTIELVYPEGMFHFEELYKVKFSENQYGQFLIGQFTIL